MASRLQRQQKKVQPVTRRATTINYFSLFNEDQIKEFKEAFSVIDQDHDGFISSADLSDMFTSLGEINFVTFLMLFGQKLMGTDPSNVLKNAFSIFDTGIFTVSFSNLREALTNYGDRYTEDEIEELFRNAPIENDLFDYNEFIKCLTQGSKINNPEAER
ncbi:unnamed protein product [Didymodactylos carnosus]|uniref:EF-hand domain-containing protein n=1 Tax=Didymodactylos carnosus TaxID=1234261 RepID=A0A813PAT6_9BILA|nr:unnamed protein product [Didymodactylos carnosus]CAF0752107.1 unnamed protein product [Didymodactylos carnosus]CAF3495140.1 unnamed protein product [Didymodactylos carnosus]CAF3531873.1 unnamed protein product [Didymodactylos carnosus]